MSDASCLRLFYMLFSMFLIIQGSALAKDEVDRLIEDELTQKLSQDLLQSIQRKFQVDLERSVDKVLVKIKLLLENGTSHIQERLADLQRQIDGMREEKGSKVDTCLSDLQNETTALVEKSLHQMVVCGYALIGHDPTEAVHQVMVLKNMINEGLKPLHDQRQEVNSLLQVCGHDHGSLKKVIKCVISKSPLIKEAMMDVTSRLLNGVVSLTKLMAHGAMHEACLIEVIKKTEDESFQLLNKIKTCVYGSKSFVQDEVDKFIKENNATVLDFDKDKAKDSKVKEGEGTQYKKDINDMLRRVLNGNHDVLDAGLKKKLVQIQKNLGTNNVLNDAVQNDD